MNEGMLAPIAIGTLSGTEEQVTVLKRNNSST